MRVGLVCPYSVSAPGGVQDQVLGLARELRDLGHVADVIAPCDGPVPTGVTSVGRSLRLPVNGSIAPMSPQPWVSARVRAVVRRGGYDVLHLHEPLAPSTTIAALAFARTPMVGTFHAAGDRTPYRWAGPVLRSLAGRLAARVAVSDAAADLARRHLGGSYEVVPNGLDLGPFHHPNPVATPARRILFLGRDEPRKGLDVLLDAMALLPADVTLWVAGSSRARGRRADARVRWLGWLTGEEKLERLRLARVLCAPSRFGESFGLVLLEAMAAGTPVVASDLPGYRSVGAGAALLVPPSDPVALAEALRNVLDDAVLAAHLRSAGEERTRTFRIGAVARRYVEIYERLA